MSCNFLNIRYLKFVERICYFFVGISERYILSIYIINQYYSSIRTNSLILLMNIEIVIFYI